MNSVGQETEASSTKEVETLPNPPDGDVHRPPTTEEVPEDLEAVRLRVDSNRVEASESSNYRLGVGRYLAP